MGDMMSLVNSLSAELDIGLSDPCDNLKKFQTYLGLTYSVQYGAGD